jgi:hypothetical protein
MAKRKLPAIGLTYHDSRDPGTIVMRVHDTYRPSVMATRRMTIHEAAELSEQLHDAIRNSGYQMVARIEKGR